MGPGLQSFELKNETLFANRSTTLRRLLSSINSTSKLHVFSEIGGQESQKTLETISIARCASNDRAVTLPAVQLDGLDDFNVSSQTFGSSISLEQTVFDGSLCMESARMIEDVDSNFDFDPGRPYPSAHGPPAKSHPEPSTPSTTASFKVYDLSIRQLLVRLLSRAVTR
ncbi:hypothetical protein BDP27DRAFT_1432029 [Rhodocollybia butyracea]|uniref:Uncharacterized protein n=1 Tax=Rhodocollybia butyracea TaxID=206335 RepID=A0A9P5P8X7_9AGAR|nr:hypothetical protein BDP27DRAFT_1432029 [Rhodocollybia butyracea]